MVTKLDKVDVVTVGVGWAGGIVAAEMTKAGYKVVGLERGEERATEDYLHGHDELKYSHRNELMHTFSKDTITHRNSTDQAAGPVREPGSYVVGTGVGGGGIHWGAQAQRYYPYDFEIRSKTIEKYGESKIPEDMTIQNWGITYDEMEPYYDKFEKTMGLSGEEDPFAGKRSNPLPTPPLKKTDAMKLYQTATEKLGYHPYMAPSGTLSEAYTNPDGQTINACQYCAFCIGYGCEYGAKADPSVTVISTAKKTGNFELRTHSFVTRVLYEGNQATGVLYRDTQTGEEFEQPADIVVLTSFTFNNARLLLLSEIGKPYNPETGVGVIGKNYTNHDASGGAVTGFFNEQKFNRFIGTGSLNITFEDFDADNFDHSDVNFIHGGQVTLGNPGNQPISNNFVPSDTPSWGEEFKKQSLHYFNRTLIVGIQQSIMSYKGNYVDLDPTYTDEAGDPLLRVTWDYGDNDRNISKFLQDKAAGVLEEMGADIIEQSGQPEHYSPAFLYQHSAGGVIMGDDPETSAVNNYMQMWDMENLFVCGASAFPHFGPTNPTLTLGALTYRATEGMIEFLENGGGQLVQAKKSTQIV